MANNKRTLTKRNLSKRNLKRTRDMADNMTEAVVEPKEKRILKLKSSDGVIFEVDEEVACLSHFVKFFIQDIGDIDSPIPVLNVASSILAKVIEYCRYHVETEQKNNSEDVPATPQDEIVAWDKEFMKVDQKTLFDLIMAATYMIIESLLNLATQKVADMIKGKTAEQIRETFGIQNDLTPAEQDEIRRENEWTFTMN